MTAVAISRSRNGDELGLSAHVRAVLNILEDFAEDKAWLKGTQKAMLNILEDFTSEKESAQDASRMKSGFLANMSHELRTPLNAIIGFTEFVMDGKAGLLNPKQEDYLNEVHANGHHLLQLINEVLDLSKIEAGKLVLHVEWFSLSPAIQEVHASIQPMAGRKRITVDVHVAPDLQMVQLDRMCFKQVLSNLLSNAIKFTGDGGSVRVRVTLRNESEFEISVEDTGIGIKPEDLRRLFVEFQQLESGTARSYQGTGLGLALTKKFVEMMGGSVSARSEFGRGSVFAVVLPLCFEVLA